ncbi:MAG: D-alanine--D-alanine ligase [Endomicrobium sp.]|jgi:D-alanine-D-alanine ligase|nr:D-alanine--D-alanine ligase [Endomicrobium sp.]
MINSNILIRANNKKIGILYGGFSSEREVSINSGKSVLNVLKKLQLNVCSIDVDRNIADKIIKEKIDIAYIMLHGSMGEDGTIQGMLEILGIPYTGCGIFASVVSMDKDISKRLFRYIGVSTPKWKVLKKFEPIPKIKRYPVVIKPSTQGSTIGLTIIENISQSYYDAIEKAFKYGDKIIVEDFIEGKEITVGVMNDEVFPVVEIIPNKGFYDFESKYRKGKSKHIIPARISREAYKIAQNYAKKIYKIFKCKSICRIDMIVDKNNKVWVLENNTIPGMTETSLIPDAGKALGYSFENLVLKILESAL